MSRFVRSARPRGENRGLLWRVPLLSSGLWLLASLLRGRRRPRQQSQSHVSPQLTAAELALADSARSLPSTGTSPQAAPKARPRWLGDPRRCATADCLLLLLAAVTIVVCLLDAQGTARLLLVLAAACLIPGSALLTLLPVEDPLEAFALAVGLGFTVEAVGALVMIWTGWWHPLGWAIALGMVACGMLALDLRSRVTMVREPR